MMKALLFDFSRTILHPTERVPQGGINSFYRELLKNGYYNFHDHFQFDEKLLEFLAEIKPNYSLYIFTTGTIQDDKEVKEKVSGLFKKIFTVPEIGKEKTDPDAYRILAKELELNPKEILFIDDTEKNIDAAKDAGLQTVRYTGSVETIRSIRRLLGIAS